MLAFLRAIPILPPTQLAEAMEVKIFCPCGSKYKFDVEPFNGKLPGPVQCPVCKADGTEAGNKIIAEALLQAAPTAPPPPQAPQPAPASVKVGIPTSSKPGTGGFVAPAVPRSSKDLVKSTPPPQPAVQHAATAIGAPPVSAAARLSVAGVHSAPAEDSGGVAVAPPPPAPSTASSRPVEEKQPSLFKGLAGAGVAGIMVLIAWFFIYTYLSRKLGFIAIILGAFVGWAAAWLGQEKSTRLGVTAALVTCGAMLLGSFWAVRVEVNREMKTMLTEMYDEELAYAKEAAKVRTDPEIRAFLAKEYSFEDEIVRPEDIQPEDIAEFKEQLPEYRRLAEGKVSRLQFEQENREFTKIYGGVATAFGLLSIGLLIWLGLGAWSAFKVASSA